jgi:hypothetical protein
MLGGGIDEEEWRDDGDGELRMVGGYLWRIWAGAGIE